MVWRPCEYSNFPESRFENSWKKYQLSFYDGTPAYKVEKVKGVSNSYMTTKKLRIALARASPRL